MQSTVTVETPPLCEPVDLDLVRHHCRIDQGDDDILLAGYLRTARSMAELYLSRALITQTLLWTMRPTGGLERSPLAHHWTIQLPRSPVQSIDSVTLTDWLGNQTTLYPSALPILADAVLVGYVADLRFTPATLRIGQHTLLAGGQVLRGTPIEAVQVLFTAGYGDSGRTVPQPIIDSILLTTAFLYEHRGDAGGEIPMAAERLLDPYRLSFLG